MITKASQGNVTPVRRGDYYEEKGIRTIGGAALSPSLERWWGRRARRTELAVLLQACFGVRCVPSPSPCLEHHKHAHKGVSVVYDAPLPPFGHLEHQNTPRMACFGARHIPSPSPCLKPHKQALVGLFVVYDTSSSPFRRLKHQNTSLKDVFWCLACSLPSPRVEPNEHTHKGMFVVFGAFPPFLSCQTPQTCPCGHVFDVQHVLCCSPHTKHYEHALVGMFVVFGAFPALPLMSDTTNMPLWACFWCSTHSLPFPLCRIPQMCPQRRVFGVRHIRRPSPLVKHAPPSFPSWNTRNVPLWAHIWCLAHTWATHSIISWVLHPLFLVFTLLVYFYIRIVSFFVCNFI